jgi:hypothetical protein
VAISTADLGCRHRASAVLLNDTGGRAAMAYNTIVGAIGEGVHSFNFAGGERSRDAQKHEGEPKDDDHTDQAEQ